MTIKSMTKDKVLQLSAADYTDRGKRRTLNEDTVFHQTSHLTDRRNAGLYLICDGMGGLNAGDVASQLVTNTIVAELAGLFYSNQWVSAKHDRTEPAFCTLTRQLERAVEIANQELYHFSQEKLAVASRMGTTATAALIYGQWLHIAHVGDSRAYLWRAGQLTQLTRDHSMAVQLLDAGLLDPAKAFKHPTRNRLLRAVGVDEKVAVDVTTQELQPGDKLLLCSDGLWQAFPDETELKNWLDSSLEPAELVRQLGAEARERDGSDNISAVLVSIDETYSWNSPFVKAMAHLMRDELAVAC
ncbi:MAG: serine/threonine-protein phosphatase [Anaerolineaceae bacterium]|nr:serine/threonine-protein phosphatase [Anaerolineaceae bacterium]MCB9099589.1 serine/threonine-protein phosphatase [Anaerolineales bacterium]